MASHHIIHPPLSLSLFSWSAKLYLTPSNSVLLTAIALIGVCVFILVIIGILHWQEKVRTHTRTRIMVWLKLASSW